MLYQFLPFLLAFQLPAPAASASEPAFHQRTSGQAELVKGGKMARLPRGWFDMGRNV
jgi:hypothetical protein